MNRFEDILVEITLEDRPKIKRPNGIPMRKKTDVKITSKDVKITSIPLEVTSKEERILNHKKMIEAEKERLKRKNVLKRRRRV